MSKKYTYNKWWKAVSKDGFTMTMNSQLYSIGIYTIIEPGQRQQGVQPSTMISKQRKLMKLVDAGEIEVEFGSSITVHEVDGLWEEYIEPINYDTSFNVPLIVRNYEFKRFQIPSKKAFTMYGFDFYVHHTFMDHGVLDLAFSVSEFTTGAKIVALWNTKKQAIDSAKEKLKEHSKEELVKTIKTKLKLYEKFDINNPSITIL